MRAALAGALALAVALPGCAAGPEPAAPGGAVRGPLTVLAAASLTEAFTRLGREFEATHPGVTVTLSFAGSSALAAQINQGAPADVFAAASPATMRPVTAAGDADGEPVVFARNQLVIAVPKGNPGGVTGLADLTRAGTRVALCAAQVPCGAAARAALDAAGVPLTPVTLERDVRGALSKVRLGEVDAALVYRTDATAAPAEVHAVEFPESAGAVNDYPIVALRRAGNPTAAREFVGFVRAERGRAALTAAGFQPPRA
ncbi:molybdate ABC transporter substrate-binding protein [Micromonospora sp. DT233]|uniref:molybdate ABC transporter substrate-binding protein n=1 Tax=Micromonospora sp. DT233 TaxID=3393432 RepID=UPI003CED1375